MPAAIPKLAVAAPLLALLAAGTARASQPPAPAPPGAVGGESVADAGHETRLKLRTPIETYFTSNLVHVQDRRVAGFDRHLDPGGRFYGMNAVWDLVLRPAARASVEVPLGRKRDLQVGLGADYYLHQQNRIADYLKLSASGACDLTRHDAVELEAKLAPHRFEKNHRVATQAVAGAYFEHAYAREVELAARYEHEWSRAIATRLEYRLEQTAYDDPFRNRDELLNEGRAALVLDVARKSRIEIGGGFGVSGSPGEMEWSLTHYPLGAVVDRSFRQTRLQASAHLAASATTALDAGLEFRNRSFTTGVSQDLVHYQRSDQLYRARVEIERKVGSGVSLGAFASFARDYSNRSDPNLTPDEAGYKELVVGGAFSWRYSTRRE